ncbi:hypothetical protein [Sphingomonas sp. GC_Shp_3]|uniref:hypothetical protein n=1 Tax=Sphingomonas sp. GC_Shp_3 TaxID=2937383 RepID=UPI00226AB0E6|nr:hypothetical protein [Sphingomonas sp. GC_Shp_3]
MEQATSTSSLIAALHARYEAAQAECHAVDLAETSARRQSEDAADCYRNACKTLMQEADALRDAILHQVPDTWSEALILQFHILCAHDQRINEDAPDDAGAALVQLAINTLFDFMCAEVRTDVAQIGAAIAETAARISRARRLRTGVVES